mgnify:CR=1 FL=1
MGYLLQVQYQYCNSDEFVMIEKNKISEEELAEIKMLQGKIDKKIFEFGNLNVEKIEIDKRVQSWVEHDKKLREEWSGLQKMGDEFINKLIEKYGEGDLDIKEGVFIPVNKEKVST